MCKFENGIMFSRVVGLPLAEIISLMISTDPLSFADPSQAAIRHIDFQLALDFDSETIHATAEYQVSPPANGSLYLDAQGLQIESLQAGGKDLDWKYDREHETRGRRLHISGLSNTERFTIEYRTSPEASALLWVAPQQTAGRVHPYLYSQCQAIQARSLFPCQDTPSVRFTYRAAVTVPAPLTAVMGI
jgi:leukotriene-A4 hydrolase